MSEILDQLREWRITIRLAGDSILYLAAKTPPPERIRWIADHKAELLTILRERAAKPVAVVPPKSEVDHWTAPPAFLSTGEPNPELWPALAERLILEVPEAARKPMRELVAKRNAFWSDCIEAVDVSRMVYVDLEAEVAERHHRRLAVWFGNEGGVQVEGVSTASVRPVEGKPAVAPPPATESFGSLFVGVK